MKYRLMDLLACPICKTFPLKLTVFTDTGIQPPKNIRKCELYCSYHGGKVGEIGETDCPTCYSKEIGDGLLECSNCGRWYPITEEIPRMLPDNLRVKRQDEDFLRKWRDRIPEYVLRRGKPFALTTA